jgi:hypothetical protein
MNAGFISAVVLGVGVATAPAWAQDAAPRKPEVAQPADEAPLAGHPVEATHEKATVVARDFQGNLRIPEPTLVEAAVKALKLEGEERDKVDAILTERAKTLDKFVEDNLDLIIRFGNAEHSTDGKEKFLLAVEAFNKLEPLRQRGPLDAQLRAAMSPANSAQFNRLLREYWNALADDDNKLLKPKGRIGIITDAKLKDLGREIESAFHRAEKSGGVLYGYLFRSMKLTDDQSKKLHDLCATYSMGGLDNKEKAAQAAFFISVTQVLEPEQRKEFGKRISGKK